MKNYRWLVAVMMILGVAGALIGCANPPEVEKAAAKTAMDAATAAHADKYATADFDAARKIWSAAEAQVQEKKYEDAKKGYIDAKTAFEKAVGGVEAGKRPFTEQASAAVAGLEAGWKDLEAAAKKAETKIEKKALWESDTKTFLEGLKAATEMVSTDPLGATAKAAQLKAFLDSYSAIFKETDATPTKPPAARKKAKAGRE